MPRTAAAAPLTKLLDHSSRPIYFVDDKRRIAYCNPALATWLAMDANRIIGRVVEYHSEVGGDSVSPRSTEAPLADLCPPPRAFFGERCSGTISCVARDGRLTHRHAEFVALDLPSDRATVPNARSKTANAVLVLLAGADMSPQELAQKLASDAPADELHRTIRQFRRRQAKTYAIESLLGDSAPMRKVRAQTVAAAESGANTLIYGPSGTGRSHVARAIHYTTGSESAPKFVPLDCTVVNDDLLRRAFDSLRHSSGEPRQRPTLLLENLESLSAAYQSQLLEAIQKNAVPARIIATTGVATDGSAARQPAPTPDGRPATTTLDPALLDAVSTITIRMPRIIERVEDLPILAQFFLEAANRGGDKQIGSIRPDALDALALYGWPGELDELREVITAAYRTCTSHEIVPTDLPAVIHHAGQTAARSPRRVERIVLDELLATVEKEAIVRAMSQTGGNKSEAAELLGMTRPRLYRRLVQLGMVQEPPTDDLQAPEFVEQDSVDNAP